ncbi:HET-domain-containing protein [Trichoderma reesei RUT C-30]|uniref:HET-domain-containing protein n=1 Tax=Hypocrea jecorina (strain ATCC 56765 / BCRC 32924 / NRRL 11460 / Rut C-30) TaxID=1344414 RepID=A0A024SJ13_HYPJR|nr:HET-domain-containing protein [Trichoderma reesei RUT C-30]
MHPTNPHKHCQFSRDTVLPLRILDLGKPEDSCSRVKLKVNETDTHAPYLALSYCWGKPLGSRKPLQLRKSNLQRLVKGIKIRKLQQSIQDAICATRKLGYRYLWVDALCIIQDCDADKGTEIGRMASIYKNASITIAASTSENAAHGFLSGEMKPYCPDYAVSIPMANGTTGTVFVSSGLYELDHPLDKRGWTLQEFMLSSRMLIFSDYELLWQCKEVDLRSVSAAGLEYLQPLETLPWTVFENEDAEPFYGDLDSDKLYLWKTIVQQYTDRQLSYTSDKLNAIMGITSELQILWRDVNIYGHWKRWFIQLLVWYKPDLKREEQRHLERAPSWSWASMDGAIRYEGMLATEDARLKSLTVQAAELSCRMLKESEVADGKAATISKLPDLIDPMTELPQKEFNGGLVEYLLLGTTKSSIGSEEGVGLLVMKCGTGVYQRLGFVKFQDMTMWEGVQRRDITLDGRINKFSAVRKQKP